jgi:hypothetical protein
VRCYALAVLGFFGVIGCTREGAVARHTVDEYRANRSLRKEMFEACIHDPGTLGSTPDCINARDAERLESMGSLRDSGPIGLEPKKKP